MEQFPLSKEEIENLIKTVEDERQKYLAEVNFRLGMFDGRINTLRAFLSGMGQPEATTPVALPPESAGEEGSK